MPLVSLAFTFTQPLKVSAQRAYAWSTDYRPNDIPLLGRTGRRKVDRLAEDTILLTDVFETPSGKVTKQKIVRLYPETLRWTNTHVSGPNRHSQFLYELEAAGKDRCKLVFTGRQVHTAAKALTAAQHKKQTAELRHEDHAMWKNLARLMEQDLKAK